MLTGIARAGISPLLGLSFKYVILSYLFWIAVLSLCAISAKVLRTDIGSHSSRKDSVSYTITVVCALLVILIMHSSLSSIYRIRWEGQTVKKAASELFRLKDDGLLSILFPEPDVVRRFTPTLKRLRLTIFRNSQNNPNRFLQDSAPEIEDALIT